MARRVALVTGAAGEMGHALIPALAGRGYEVVGFDLLPLDPEVRGFCREAVEASLLDESAVRHLFREHRPAAVFHLAAMLSAKAEQEPDLAHEVNVNGTMLLFRLSRELAETEQRPVRFLFPSSIAVYGLPDRETKERAGAVREEDWNAPAGLYGCNKLYMELVGVYFAKRAEREGRPGLDFRAIRFPGLISAETLPTGGTSDYAPEMIHRAAQGLPYSCFVSEQTRLPFLTMPDAIEALTRLAEAPASSLSRRVYNVGGFSPTARELAEAVRRHYPDFEIVFEPVPERQAMVDTWPADVDDRRARQDWGHAPRYRLDEALRDYLVPALGRRYAARAGR
jgi:nucleoside-diphosphate-sugar epimerase